MLLLTGIMIPEVTMLVKNFYVIQPVTCVDSDFHPTTCLSDWRKEKHVTHD